MCPLVELGVWITINVAMYWSPFILQSSRLGLSFVLMLLRVCVLFMQGFAQCQSAISQLNGFMIITQPSTTEYPTLTNILDN